MNGPAGEGGAAIPPGQSPARSQDRRKPQHLLLTLLGDYWYEQRELLPSAALVELLGEFGVTGASARAALSRLQRRDLLKSSRSGRNTAYGLTEQAESLLAEGRRRILRFGLDEQPWDGSWTVVCFSVPERDRQLRHALRTRLAWLGFASLYDGVWVSPHRPVGAIRRELADLGVTRASVFVGRAPEQDTAEFVEAWDLDELRSQYVAFIEEFGELLERTRLGGIGTAEALVVRTRVMDEWRRFPKLDPELPAELMPPEWPRAQAREVFMQLYDDLGTLAVARVQQILTPYDPEIGARAHFHTTTVTDAA